MKRNDVVTEKANSWFYGRVISCLGPIIKVVDCGKQVRFYHESELAVHDYRGYWQPKYDSNDCLISRRFISMPTLRRLKQHASGYNPEVWKKPKRKPPRNPR